MIHLFLRTPADIGALIKDRRKALGLDQSDLADRIGVSRLWVNQIERGKPGAGIGLVLRALAALGVELTAASGGDRNGQRLAPVDVPDINAAIDKTKRRDER